jgi:tRNA-modifying protein YgfZ
MSAAATPFQGLPTGLPQGPVTCDVTDLSLLAFEGPDAATFLQGQLSNDVVALLPGAVQWTSYNSPKGRMLATLLLWRDGSDAFHALVAADLAEAVRKRLSMFVLRAKVRIADLTPDRVLVGVGGRGAAEAVHAALGACPAPGRVTGTESLVTIGFPDGRIVVVAAAGAPALQALRAHASTASPETWRWLGVRAGVAQIGAATQDLFVPQTANWDLVDGVNFHKGCYTGQEIIARTQYLGRLKERMRLFHLDGAPPAPATKIYGSAFADQACGMVVNAAAAPSGGSDLLAVVQSSALEAPPLRLAAPDGPALEVQPLPYAIPAAEAAPRPKL